MLVSLGLVIECLGLIVVWVWSVNGFGCLDLLFLCSPILGLLAVWCFVFGFD